MSHHHKQTHSHRQTKHTHTHTYWRTHTHAHRDIMYKKAWICSAEEFLELYGKVEAVFRNCLLPDEGTCLRYLVPTFSISVSALNILPFLCSDRSIFPLVPSFSLLQQKFYVQKWGKFEPLYLSNESRFLKMNFFFILGLTNVSQKFQTSSVNRKCRSGRANNWCLDAQKSPFSLFFLRFSQESLKILKSKEKRF